MSLCGYDYPFCFAISLSENEWCINDWMLHHSRVKNLIRASITRMKKLYHKKLRMMRERTLLFGFHLDDVNNGG